MPFSAYTAVPNWLAGATMKRNRLVKMVLCRKSEAKKTAGKGAGNKKGGGKEKKGCVIL